MSCPVDQQVSDVICVAVVDDWFVYCTRSQCHGNGWSRDATALCCAATQDRVALGLEDGVLLLDSKGKVLRHITGGPVTAVDVSDVVAAVVDGALLGIAGVTAVVCHGTKIAAGGDGLFVFDGDLHTLDHSGVCCLGWSDKLVSADVHGVAKVWDGARCVRSLDVGGWPLAIAYADKRLAVQCRDALRVFDDNDRICTSCACRSTTADVVVRNGRVSAVSAGARLRWWRDAREGLHLTRIPVTVRRAILVDRDDEVDVVVLEPFVVRVYRATRQGSRLVGSVDGDATGPKMRPAVFEVATAWARGDATLVATADSEGAVAIWEFWDAVTLLASYRDQQVPVRSLSHSSPGLFKCDVLGAVTRVFSDEEHCPQLPTSSNGPWVYADVDPWCLVSFEDRELVVWDPHAACLRKLKPALPAAVRLVAVATPELAIACATDDGVFVWRRRSLDRLASMQGTRGLRTYYTNVHVIIAWNHDQTTVWHDNIQVALIGPVVDASHGVFLTAQYLQWRS